MPAAKSNHFRLLQEIQPDYSSSSFTEYESDRTGMRVVVVDQKGPKVNGYFVLATEIHDDSGAPHTLEHLCFMGSKSFRYKGFLDKIATRAYSGTNAWTATDHTAYTLDTAGWAGFAQILPVYLEHVIVPTLTDSACCTEVYHLDGSGHDAGVVYSEMQGVQNDASELIDLQARRLLYPEGVGFRYETGGMMDQLRVLTAERIRQFHRDMYQPKNLCLIITGEVDHTDMLKILNTFEETILNDIPSPEAPFKRPWIDSAPAPDLKETIVQKVEFPEEDESTGEIEIRFLGPDCSDVLLSGALNVVLLYLAGSSATVLENVLVEKEQVASAVYYNTVEHPKTEIQFTLSSVETEKLADVEKRFFQVLSEAMSKSLDMEYLHECIRRQKRAWKFQTEAAATAFANYVIADYLYGKRDGSTLRDVASLKEYDELLTWEEQQWKDFINKWLTNAPHVSILGVPSAKLSEKLKEDEEQRVKERVEKLGKEGLAKLQEKLDMAKEENDVEIPRKLLEQFEVPGADSIHFIETTTARSGAALKLGRPENDIQKIVDADKSDNPLFIQYEHVPSNFVQVSILVSVEEVPVELRPLLTIYTESLFSLPISRGGKKIPFEQVIVELERDNVAFSASTARGYGNSESLCISLTAEREKYSTAIEWIQEVLWSGVFDIERLKAINTRLLADIPELKRSGDSMLSAVAMMTHFTKESLPRARGTLTKALYLKRIKHLLGDSPTASPKSVVGQMNTLRMALFKYSNLRILVVTDLTKLAKPVSSWEPFVKELNTHSPIPSPPGDLQAITRRIDRLSPLGLSPGKTAYIIPMPTIDTSYAYCAAKGPSTYTDPSLPALMVATAYLNAAEGPLWNAVRGPGLAYGAFFLTVVEAGFIYWDVYQSPNVHKAFVATKDMIEGLASGATPLDDLMLEGAISSIVVGYANDAATMAASATSSFIMQVIRGLPKDFNQEMLKKVRAVTEEDVRAAMKEKLLPLFKPGQMDLFVTAAPVLAEPIEKGFQSEGFAPQVQPLTHFQDDYGLKVGDGSDDAADEDEEDDDDDEEEDDYEDQSPSGSDDDAESGEEK